MAAREGRFAIIRIPRPPHPPLAAPLAFRIWPGGEVATRAEYAVPSRVARSSAILMGYPSLRNSLPYGEVDVFWPSIVVGAICPPVTPHVVVWMKRTVMFSPRFAAWMVSDAPRAA